MDSYKMKYINWKKNINFLKDQISKIEKLKDAPIIAISVFSLKAQLIEFELKQLLAYLDLFLFDVCGSSLLKRKIRTPKDFDDHKFTLGCLSEELKQFKATFLYDLQEDISSLVIQRNRFVHNLFSLGNIESLYNKANEGIKLSNKILEEFSKIYKKIEEENKIMKIKFIGKKWERFFNDPHCHVFLIKVDDQEIGYCYISDFYLIKGKENLNEIQERIKKEIKKNWKNIEKEDNIIRIHVNKNGEIKSYFVS